MKTIETNYVFDYDNRTITLSSRKTVERTKLYAILNLSRGTTYYTLGGSQIQSIDGNVITLLPYSPAFGESSSDTLFILYEDSELLETLAAVRRVLVQLSANVGAVMPDGAGRLRVNAEVVANIGTITTVTTVSNIASVGGLNAANTLPALMQTSMATGWRANIKITE
jgi:hypothetical protein